MNTNLPCWPSYENRQGLYQRDPEFLKYAPSSLGVLHRRFVARPEVVKGQEVTGDWCRCVDREQLVNVIYITCY